MPKYYSKAETTEITASSRVSVKVKDNFYTFEFTEKRIIPVVVELDTTDKSASKFDSMTKFDIKKEREILWDCVHGEVDKQVQEILELNK